MRIWEYKLRCFVADTVLLTAIKAIKLTNKHKDACVAQRLFELGAGYETRPVKVVRCFEEDEDCLWNKLYP